VKGFGVCEWVVGRWEKKRTKDKAEEATWGRARVRSQGESEWCVVGCRDAAVNCKQRERKRERERDGLALDWTCFNDHEPSTKQFCLFYLLVDDSYIERITLL
jgi:hypothetical protein